MLKTFTLLNFVAQSKKALVSILKARASVREKAGRKALDAGDALVKSARAAVVQAEKARAKLIDKAGDLATEAGELRKEAAKLEG